MKNKYILVVICALVFFNSNALVDINEILQDKKVVTLVGTFDGYDQDDGYAFLVKNDSADDAEAGEQTIYIQSMSDAALKMINLKSKDMEGKRFEIVCEVTEYQEKDDNGEIETFEKYHITSIKKI